MSFTAAGNKDPRLVRALRGKTYLRKSYFSVNIIGRL